MLLTLFVVEFESICTLNFSDILSFLQVFKCCENYIEEIVAPPNCLDFLLAGETYSMSKVLHSSERCLLENFSVVSIQVSAAVFKRTGRFASRPVMFENDCSGNFESRQRKLAKSFNLLHIHRTNFWSCLETPSRTTSRTVRCSARRRWTFSAL